MGQRSLITESFAGSKTILREIVQGIMFQGILCELRNCIDPWRVARNLERFCAVHYVTQIISNFQARLTNNKFDSYCLRQRNVVQY